MQHRLLLLLSASVALGAGCSALVSPDVARLGDAGPRAGDAGVAPSPDGGSCPGTTIVCGGACVDPASDPDHCGGCGRACGAGVACISGVCDCRPGDPACAPPLGNPDRCGGMTCRDDQICAGDRCACRPGLTGVGGQCVDLSSDPMNCGAVGNRCPEVCTSGACRDRCGMGLIGCDGACVDPSSDVLNCGECGRSCDRDQVCVTGRCRDYVAAPSCDACGGDTPRCCDYAMASICVDASGCPI